MGKHADARADAVRGDTGVPKAPTITPGPDPTYDKAGNRGYRSGGVAASTTTTTVPRVRSAQQILEDLQRGR